MPAKKERLDVALVRRGLVPTRERAQALIMAGQVYVGDRQQTKPGVQVALDAECRIAEVTPELKYVSRGGLKLEKALDTFHLDPSGKVALDVGASTGGFTQVLLERGASRVYAVDVGHGQLAWSLRNDPRVVVMERTNIRHLTELPEAVQCAVIDVSFISLRLVLPALEQLLERSPETWIASLVKPQFEAGKKEADRGGGIISDPAVHQRVLAELQEWIPQHTAFQVKEVTASPILGRDGNREFLFHLRFSQ
ncbi:23S rRNA (cytidine1920-2'-O)/16S rRNA (cytidine1409-2'-O)-methyltransferase [Thermosporothrix hazakensis]|jgi:23S rRNA (cytidine1920-2'-O)/16S rRNA (cytidine1409-2'-O)-methyltransferase|uniref:23S rRNA (Cytidine1920-2'-O)/16S rRNA (Cytidine1409-2'-O)-methyltransferase n=1 Tax=Thermosporothrix hazakensis TaxID=644383 RepID=A0A326TY13_THEHA|nr:TlyA family RNA methyltransferase [Thermosporothrix hazakensis]PZW22178.1 23S rRNA (cytidine1920-2'-O)/16S rRNA (cytidine1409-2'-O)-methyltransferase [Thermosporothrix hazakensis]GCE48099.1 TlyA family rRNA (cytidine-2'-O)-methyltransferase [Thermosporothrix hazakensis]